MRKGISGLIRGGKPVIVMTMLVAVVAISGTAYAGKGGDGNGKKDGSKTAAAAEQKSQGGSKADWTAKTEWTSRGDQADAADHSDRTGKATKKWKHKKKPKHGNGNNGGNNGGNTDESVEYGVATVNVSRGGNPATAWATYSTALGSPVGDTTGGTFRFTCSTANAPCSVWVAAAVLSDEAGTATVYPRVLIHRQDYETGGPSVYCEYGDGSTGAAPAVVTQQALSATPTYFPIELNIGGSDDCGLAGPAGDVDQIIVPAGYYDVQTTVAFLP